MPQFEQVIASESLDRPPPAGEPRKLFICSAPGSGVQALTRQLIGAGVGVPHAYFNPSAMLPIAVRFGVAPPAGWRNAALSLLRRLRIGKPRPAFGGAFLRDYIAALIRARCQGGIFAATLEFGQLAMLLADPAGRRLLGGGSFVWLRRDDVLEQAVNAYFASISGAAARTAKPDLFDMARIDRALQDLLAENLNWQNFFARNGLSPLTVSTEETIRDPQAVLNAIAGRLGIAPVTAASHAAPLPGSPELPSVTEVARCYVATFRTLQEAWPSPPVATAHRTAAQASRTAHALRHFQAVQAD